MQIFLYKLYILKCYLLFLQFLCKIIIFIVFMLLLCHVRVCGWIYTLYFAWMSRNSLLEASIRLVKGWVFVYELTGCGFESRCCQVIFIHTKVLKTKFTTAWFVQRKTISIFFVTDFKLFDKYIKFIINTSYLINIFNIYIYIYIYISGHKWSIYICIYINCG